MDMPGADLCDDLVYLIVLRLPLKQAIQCKTLNKYLYNLISHPDFNHKHALLSSTNPINHTILFYASICGRTNLTRFSPESTTPLQLGVFGVSVLASCNGLLFLAITNSDEPKHYVFNPITGQALAVDHDMINDLDDCKAFPHGLAVELGDGKTNVCPCSITLVLTYKTRSGLKFKVITPAGSSTILKSEVDFACGASTWLEDKKTGPVYLNGALHWLGGDLGEIIVFDVEKEQAKIVAGPFRKGFTVPGAFYSSSDELICTKPKVWFGLAQGSLSFVHTLKEVITIHAHDYVNDEWRIQHRIANIIDPRNYVGYKIGGIPVYFDGETLLFQLPNEGIEEGKGKREGKGERKQKRERKGEVYVHKISSKSWEKKKVVGGSKHDPLLIYIPFLPTLAKVIDDDDHRPNKNYEGLNGISELQYECLFQLQKLFRQH